jgi:hypothetical protein
MRSSQQYRVFLIKYSEQCTIFIRSVNYSICYQCGSVYTLLIKQVRSKYICKIHTVARVM